MIIKIIKKRSLSLSLILLVNIVLGMLSIYPMIIMQKAIDTLIVQKNLNIFIKLAITYILIYIITYILKILTYNKAKYWEINFIRELRNIIITSILNAKSSSIEKIGENTLSQKFIEDLIVIENNMINLLLDFTFSISNFIIGILILLQNDIFITIIIFPITFISTLLIKYSYKYSNKVIELEKEAKFETNKFFYDSIIGSRDIIIFCKEKIFLKKFANLQNKSNQISKKAINIQNISQLITNLSFNVIIGLLVLIGGFRVVNASLTIGGLVAILMYNSMITDPIFNFVNHQKDLLNIKNSLARIDYNLNLIKKREEKIFSPLKNIKFYKVTLNFGDIKILDNFNFVINKGDIIRIEGKTGSGKSSIAKLLTDLYSVSSGEILINGNKKEKISISSVFQSNYLFDAKIEDNIRFLENVDDEKFYKVIEIAKVNEIIQKHENENIGDRANKLSGGERTRILIARALLKDSDLYIFDEISTGLDEKLFNEIVDDIINYLKDKTIIFIDHKSIDNKYFNKSISL